ncbi:MAG: DUF2949 domain-containing protein [Leptolyngbyaceae cyanobacterium SL_7_1]|nr:DUF2949 domain-containing protein [Leptolyngbyaceae cyanobacterium SL_7_1]
MNTKMQTRLIQFLQNDLAIPADSVAMALRHHEPAAPTLLPMVMWQYGLITLEQLDQVFDWMETV